MQDTFESPESEATPKSVTRDWRWLWVPLVVFVISRVFIFGAAYYSQSILPDPFEVRTGDEALLYPNDGWLGMWMRWDSVAFILVADYGYDFPGLGTRLTPRLPLYPILIDILNSLFGGNSIITSLVISNGIFILALILLYRLTLELVNQDHGVAARTAFYITFFPPSFHYAAPYSESLFLLLTVLVVWASIHREWWLAALAGGLASATRLQGILMLLPVGVAWASSHGWTVSRMLQPSAWRNLWRGIREDTSSMLLLLITIPLGMIFYMWYLWGVFGSPFVFNELNKDSQPIRFWEAINAMLNGELFNPIFIVGMVYMVLALMISVSVWRRFGIGLAGYCMISVLLPAPSLGFDGIPRYVSVLFPLFIVLGIWGQSKPLDRTLKVLFSLGLAITAFLYVQYFQV